MIQVSLLFVSGSELELLCKLGRKKRSYWEISNTTALRSLAYASSLNSLIPDWSLLTKDSEAAMTQIEFFAGQYDLHAHLRSIATDSQPPD